MVNDSIMERFRIGLESVNGRSKVGLFSCFLSISCINDELQMPTPELKAAFQDWRDAYGPEPYRLDPDRDGYEKPSEEHVQRLRSATAKLVALAREHNKATAPETHA